MLRAMTATCVIVLTACAAPSRQSKTSSTAPQTAEEKAAAEKDKKDKEDEKKFVCTYERATGTNFPEKVCRLREEVDAEREKAQQTVRDVHPTATKDSAGGG